MSEERIVPELRRFACMLSSRKNTPFAQECGQLFGEAADRITELEEKERTMSEAKLPSISKWRRLFYLLCFWFNPGNVIAWELIFQASNVMDADACREAADYLVAKAKIKETCNVA